MSDHPPVTRYLFSESEPQKQRSKEDISIRNLFNDRELYANYPTFQRGYVWPDKYKRALIDSILRGFPIHPMLAYKELDNDGRERYWIIDGRQRLSTVYDFMQGKFRTSTISLGKAEERKLPPIEPGRHFQELSDRARNLFLSYTFVVNVVDGTEKVELEVLFRRIQNQLKLTASERLTSYSSKAKDYAHQLQEHAIWTDFYTGENDRKQLFQGCMMLIALELAQGYVNLNTGLNDLASGVKDKLITPNLCEAIESRLEVVMHVFAGTAFCKRTTIIPMYQAVMFLEKQGHTFTSSDKGCLTPWLGHVLSEADQTGLMGFSHPIVTLRNINKQQDFWQVQLPLVAEYCKKQPEGVV